MGLDIKVLSSLNKALLDKWIWSCSEKRIKFWQDTWCRDLTLKDSFPFLFSFATYEEAWVVDLWDGVRTILC
ncbi:hypothetical protein CK203_100469 [Vitis vinifera]|uniref:Reverse transcriptase zinc-binding domain-containing protein n=1 Tax=Vitis vinifera TaxID=29760 RepID=A0A438CUY4_VITVI|nr:hypothetical protein CK203_100469 [Vitis vinifera]